MNLPLLSHGMQNIIIGFCFCLFFAGATIYLTKYRFKKPNTRKWRIITAMALLGIILAYILFYTASNMIGRYQVRARFYEMKALGIPIEPSDIIPKKPKDNSKNGAFFYKAAFNLLEADDPSAKLYKIINNEYDVAAWSDKGKAKILLDSKNLNQIFTLFSLGANKPCAVYDREFIGIKTSLSELRKYRSLFRLIAMKSSYCGFEGKPDAGYKLIRDGYKSISQFLNEPYLISQLVNIACLAINNKTLNNLASKYGISNTRAAELIELLNELDTNKAVKTVIDGESILLHKDLLEGIMSDRYPSEELKKMGLINSTAFSIWPLFYQDYAYVLSRNLEARAFFDQPYWQIEPAMKEWMKKPRPLMLISTGASETFGHARTKSARINTEIEATKLTLALHIFKNNNGRFPEKLEELTPVILKRIPADPVSGKAFGYRKQGGYFILDSVWLKEKRKMEQKRQKRYKKRHKK